MDDTKLLVDALRLRSVKAILNVEEDGLVKLLEEAAMVIDYQRREIDAMYEQMAGESI